MNLINRLLELPFDQVNDRETSYKLHDIVSLLASLSLTLRNPILFICQGGKDIQ